MEPFVNDQDFTLSVAEVETLRAALTIPGCWNPRLRDEALSLLDDLQQLSLLAEPA